MAKRKLIKIETTVADAVSTAFGVITELAEEMRDAFDNTPKSLQQSGVGEARGEAADTLESISEPDVPEDMADIKIEFETLPLMARASRAQRLSDGLHYAYLAIEAAEAAEGLDEDEVSTFTTEVQDMIDEAEGVEFPGMFG